MFIDLLLALVLERGLGSRSYHVRRATTEWCLKRLMQEHEAFRRPHPMVRAALVHACYSDDPEVNVRANWIETKVWRGS
jgi:hypothetical protein